MSDRVAVFNQGKIEQVASPRILYTQPLTPFVADFVGTSNVFDATLAQTLCGRSTAFSIRPERIQIIRAAEATQGIRVDGELIDIQYLGAVSRFEVKSAPGKIISVVMAEASSTGSATNSSIDTEASTIRLTNELLAPFSSKRRTR